MTYFFDPYSGGHRRGRPSDAIMVSAAELQKLQQMAAHLEQENRELKATIERLTQELRQKTQEIEIKEEALRKQSEYQKQLEAEVVFLRAALAEANEKSAPAKSAPGKSAPGAENSSWQDRYLRLQADLDNLRRRLEQRSNAEVAENRRQILADMLPLADHLDLALQHLPQTEDPQVRNFIANIEATRRAFLETLRRYGVDRIEPLHEPFDPGRHEAVGATSSESVPADHVVSVVQAGYSEGDRLIRPARVLISSGSAQSGQTSETDRKEGQK